MPSWHIEFANFNTQTYDKNVHTYALHTKTQHFCPHFISMQSAKTHQTGDGDIGP